MIQNAYHTVIAFIFFMTGPVLLMGQSLENELDSISYSVGMMVAQSVSGQIGEVSYEAFLEGFRHQMEGSESRFSITEAQELLNAYGATRHRKKFNDQITAGKAFLEENAKRPEVVVLDNGLQYEVIQAGPEDAPKPGPEDQVKVHYHGTLISGEVFDSSVDRGEPATFAVNRVISGWTQILQLMPVGSKWKVYIPENLAYGARGTGKIGPYTTLIFEIELLEIL